VCRDRKWHRADAGLVEGIADASGGRSDFVASGNDLSKLVISQLELSMQPSLGNVKVNIAGHEAIEITPFPIRPLFPGVASTLFVRDASGFSDGPAILVTADHDGSQVEFNPSRRKSGAVSSRALRVCES
jgi:hypothetical protein